ncbi:MAG: hypothetical protein U0931_28450 [Vulcanimicrobiota bacterium]
MPTLEEAVALLNSDGPASADQIAHLTRQTHILQQAVAEYEASMVSLHDGLSQEEKNLLAGVHDLVNQFVENQNQLAQGLRDTDAAVRGLVSYFSSTQDQLKSQLSVATSRMQSLQDQWHKYPPALQQAVDHQHQALQSSQQKVQATMDALGKRVDVAAEHFGNLKQHSINHQQTVGSHVESLVHQVKATQTHAQGQSEGLKANTARSVQSFETNLQNTLSTVVDKPGQQINQALTTLKTRVEGEIGQQMSHLLDKGLGQVLRSLQNIGRRNDNIVAELQRMIPDRLAQGARSFGYVVSHLDLILRKLADQGISAAQNFLNGAIDGLAKHLGINLDLVKNAINAVADTARFAVNVGLAPLTMVRTILTDPGQLANEIGHLRDSATNAARSAGKMVGI